MMTKPSADFIVDPDQRIIDAHHHLVMRDGKRYLIDDYIADMTAGHRIVASVYVQSGAIGYRSSGPPQFRPVGETEFAVAASKEAQAQGIGGVCAAIVASADLLMGAAVKDVLDRHEEAAEGRLRGVRYTALFDDGDEYLAVTGLKTKKPAGLLLDSTFQAGIRALGLQNLCFDTAIFHPQLTELAVAAEKCPETTIVLNHMGFALGIGRYAGKRAEVFEAWKRGLAALSKRPNVIVKIGGLGIPLWGFDFHQRVVPAGYLEIAEAWRPYIETCIEIFGPSRCMMESNFPTDRHGLTYPVLWNALKHVLARYSEDERDILCFRTANKTYKLQAREE